MANEANIKAVITAEDKASGVIRGVGDSFGKLTAGVALGTAAYNAINSTIRRSIGFLKDSENAANTQELALTRLQAGINNVSSATDKHIGGLVRQAEGLQRVTRFSDEAIESAQGILTTFQANQPVIATLTPLLIDMSEGLARVTGEMPDLESSALAVGKALGSGDASGLATILRRYGVIMTDAQNNTLQLGNYQQRLATITSILGNNFKGLGAAAGDTAAGKLAQFKNSINDVQEKIGNLQNMIIRPLASAFTTWFANNSRVIISLGAATIGVLGFAAAIFALVKIIPLIGVALRFVFLTPWGLILTALAAVVGVVLYKAFDKLQSKMISTGEAAKKAGDGLGNAIPVGASKASQAIADTAQKMSDLNEQIGRANRDFREQLAEMIKGHQDKISTFKQQLDQENADFKDSQEKEVRDHQSKVDDLTSQINQLLNMGRGADQQKLASLQAELIKENQAFAQQQAKEKADHDAKLKDIQTQLNAEMALLKKHASDVKSIRNSDFVDEIDKLKRSHNEQLEQFDKQKRDIIKNAQDTTQGVEGAFSTLPDSIRKSINNPMADLGKTLGNSMGNAIKQALKDSLTDIGKGTANWFGKVATFVAKGFDPRKSDESLSNVWKEASNDPAFKFRAKGGPVSGGSPYIVGEQGPELFMPNNGGSIIPNDKLGSGQTVNITIQAGAMMGNDVEARKFAQLIIKHYNDAMGRKGGVAYA